MKSFKQYLKETDSYRESDVTILSGQEFLKRTQQDKNWLKHFKERLVVRGELGGPVVNLAYLPSNIVFEDYVNFKIGTFDCLSGTFLNGVNLENCACTYIENLRAERRTGLSSYSLRIHDCERLEVIDADVDGPISITICDNLHDIKNLRTTNKLKINCALLILHCPSIETIEDMEIAGSLHISNSGLMTIKNVNILGTHTIENISLEISQCPDLKEVSNVKFSGEYKADEHAQRIIDKMLASELAKDAIGNNENELEDLFS